MVKTFSTIISSALTASMHTSTGYRSSITPARPHSSDPRVRLERLQDANKYNSGSRVFSNGSENQNSAASVRRHSLLQASQAKFIGSPSIENAAGDVARLGDEAFTLAEGDRVDQSVPLISPTKIALPNTSPVVVATAAKHGFKHRSNISSVSDITQYASTGKMNDSIIMPSADAPAQHITTDDTEQVPVESAAAKKKQAIKVRRVASNSQIGSETAPSSNKLHAGSKKADVCTNEPSASGCHFRKKKKGSKWLQALNPNYKYRAEEFNRYFVTPSSRQQYAGERLVIEYSCALQREILCQGRMYCSQHRLCFRFNIFGVERSYDWPWTQISSIRKDKTALIIPNAISVRLAESKHDGEHLFFTTFNARDKAFTMLMRLFQSANSTLSKRKVAAADFLSAPDNSLPNPTGYENSNAAQQLTASDFVAPLTAAEVWSLVHFSYGENLGLTTDDEDDYISPAYLKYQSSSHDEVHDNTVMPASGTSSVGSGGSSKANKAAVTDVSSRRSSNKRLFGRALGHSSSASTTAKERVSTPKGRHAEKKKTTAEAVGESTPVSSSLADVSHSGSSPETTSSRRDAESPLRKHGRKHSCAVLHVDAGEQYYAEYEKNVDADMQTNKYIVSRESPALTDYTTDWSTDNQGDDEDGIDASVIIPRNLPQPSGNVLLDELFDLSVDQVFVMLFSDSKFCRDFFDLRGFADVQFSNWGDVSPTAAKFVSANRASDNAVHERSITYRVKAMPGQWSTSIERQRLLPESINGYLYLVQAEVRNSGIMYADSFAVCCYYALTNTGDNSCRLCVHGEPVFLKRVLLARSMIESKVTGSFREHFGLLRTALQEATRDEIPKFVSAGQAPASGNESDVGLKHKMPELHKLADPPLPLRAPPVPAADMTRQRCQNTNFSASSSSSIPVTHQIRRPAIESRTSDTKMVDEEDTDSSEDDKRSTLRANAVPPGAAVSLRYRDSSLLVKNDFASTHLRRKSSKQRHQSQSPDMSPPLAVESSKRTRSQISSSPLQAEAAGTLIHRCSACGHLDVVCPPDNITRPENTSTRTHRVTSYLLAPNFIVPMLLLTLIVLNALLLWRVLSFSSLGECGTAAAGSTGGCKQGCKNRLFSSGG